MNLAIFLSFKESMAIQKNVGQDERFIHYYLKPYSNAFDNIYIFGWENETFEFPFKNVALVPNSRSTNPYCYNLTLPFVHKKILKECSVIRLMQFTSIVPAAISKLLYKSKIVATYGFPYRQFLKIRGRRFQSAVWKAIEWLLLPVVVRFITTYQKTADYLAAIHVPLEKISILPNGVDIDVFKPIAKKRPSEKMEILFVGRFEPEKNIINLAKSLSLIEHKNFTITLIGKGMLEENVRQILNDKNIYYKIIPPVPHNTLVARYQSADLFLLPSVKEGYPKVLIEAMACGVPCVVGIYPGYSDIVTDGKNGIACGFDPKSIAEGINKLIASPELRKQVSQNARKFVEKNNDIKKLIAKEIDIINSVK